MAIRTYKVTLDSKNTIASEPVYLRQGDKTGAVVIDATLMDNGAPVSLDGLTPMFKANTADGQAVIADSIGFNIVNASGGEFTYQVPSQLGSVDGKIKIAYFSFSDSSGAQSTFNVVFVVEKAADITQESAKDWASNLNNIINQYNQWVNDAHSSWQDFVNENKEIIESIDPGGTLLTEIIAARNGKSDLKTRLDDEHAQVTEQLAQIATNITSFFKASDSNWTPAIRRAIDATPMGGTLLIPPKPSGYLIQAQAEKYLFKLEKPIRIIGYGSTSMLVMDEGIPADTDIFLLSPKTASDIEGYEISGITGVGANGSTPARHFINIDTSLPYQKIARSLFSRNFIYPTGGWSIYLTNPTNSDGFFASQIEKNLLDSGINLKRGGDSLTVIENTIAGYNGVDVSLVEGSNTFVFAWNNLTARRGIIIRGGHNIKILDNDLEVGYSDSSYVNGALLDIDGTDIPYEWGLLAVEILGNNITYQTTAPEGITGIRINKARGAIIEGNYITNKNSTMIEITAAAQETRLGYNLYSSVDPSGIIKDTGRNTIRETVQKDNPFNGVREVYEIDAAVARWKANAMWELIDNKNIESITGGNAPTLNHIWQAENAFSNKYKLTTQQRGTDGVLGAQKAYSYLGDGYQYFVNGGFALMSPDGFRWKVNVNNDGTLSTNRMV